MGQTHTCTFEWGEGTPQTVPAGATSCTATHQYRDDNPTLTPSDTYAVKVTVTDNGTTNGSPDPKYDSETANLVVNNLAPVILSMTGPAGPQAIGTASTVSTTFTDVGTQDTHKCTFTWDDATPATTVNATGGTCSANHTYAAAGVYSVTVTVKDDDTGSDTETFTTFIVIYDPNGGFVTGGGWINSPAERTLANPALDRQGQLRVRLEVQEGRHLPRAKPSSSSKPAT